MRYRLTHITEYLYTETVERSRNEAYLLPRSTDFQHSRFEQLEISPYPADLRERRDFFENRVLHFAIQEPHEKLYVKTASEIEVTAQPDPFACPVQLSWERALEQTRTAGSDLVPFRLNSSLLPISAAVYDFAHISFIPGRPLLEAAHDLMSRIFQDFSYNPGYTTVSTPLTQVLKDKKGVCQDFAHVGIACVRSLGLAARYVSGYMETLPPPGKKRLIGADASHAWFSVWIPEIGWVDFDPTNNQLAGEQYITVAWGRDFSDVSPLKGVALGGGKQAVRVSVDVERWEN